MWLFEKRRGEEGLELAGCCGEAGNIPCTELCSFTKSLHTAQHLGGSQQHGGLERGAWGRRISILNSQEDKVTQLVTGTRRARGRFSGLWVLSCALVLVHALPFDHVPLCAVGETQ